MIKWLIGLLWTIFVIWVFIDIILSRKISLGGKILWMIVCLVIPVIGVLLYFFFGRK